MNKGSKYLGLMLLALSLSAPICAVGAQNVPGEIKMSVVNESLSKALKRLEKSSGYRFVYSNDDVSKYSVSANVSAKNVQDALKQLLKNVPLTYSVEGKYVTITPSNGPETQKQQQKTQQVQKNSGKVILKGRVADVNNESLPGAYVMTGSNRHTVVTDAHGSYAIEVDAGKKDTIIVQYVGMKRITKYVMLNKDQTLNFTMQENENELNDVIVNGMFERRAESFTGSSVTFSGDELMQISNQNLFSSLKNLDPAFQIVENVDMGSNPNSMPNIQLRGQTSFNLQGDYDGNANQPLFILDGFETTLEKVYDLDMNRIKSVTLLKDAAAKAVYGSKAGNGVVVIETIRPKSGEMRISYNGNLNIEAPDLTGYNLMNAQEKYNWEVEHGKYDNWLVMNNPQLADNLQKSVYDAIQSGVDTYWLSKPLQTGVDQKHSISLEGGDSKVRYLLGASYNGISGAMKGSNRRTFDINSTLSYTYKNMVFRNQIDFTSNKAKESPYGSFSDYVELEPYYAPYDSDGNLKKILGYETCYSNSYANPVYNPLYNATLNNKNESNYQTFLDNFAMDWHINENWRFTAQLGYTHTNNGSDVFYPSSHTMFIDYDTNGLGDRKGQYTKTTGKTNDFNLQAGINWNKMFGKHAIFFNGTWNMQTTNTVYNTVVGEGFGNDNMNDISMANYYLHDSHPTGSDNKTREMGVVGTLNYSYDDRYLVDFTLRETGSSVYGSDNHWGTFWSAGAGWNLHHEKFMQNAKLIKQLKLRYSLGYTGTQNFNPYQARAKYQYTSQVYDGRMGTYIMGIPNFGLKWQKVLDHNIGLDVALGSFLTLRAEYYIQNTDNMLTDITLPASTGFSSYKANMGELQNKGYEFSIGFTPWRDNKSRSWVTFTASGYHNNNKISKIYDIFKKNNDDADDAINSQNPSYSTGSATAEEMESWKNSVTRPATKYYEGCSMTAIWAVRSLGIDPMSGQEMFLDKNGDVTYTYSTDDQVVCGDTSAKLRGSLGISGGWNGWTLSVYATYKFGGDYYNQTLVDRVENITGFGNLDKRVSETWVNPGDNASYKYVEMRQSPTDYPDLTKPTSRFIQKDNELYVSSVNLGYEFYKAAWLQKVGLERLKLSFYCNELFRFNSIKVERGLSYPFARTFSFSLNATF